MTYSIGMFKVVYNCFAQEDNKFYQLELVNRETNFNKVFNSSPTVGVINPLTKVCVYKYC